MKQGVRHKKDTSYSDMCHDSIARGLLSQGSTMEQTLQNTTWTETECDARAYKSLQPKTTRSTQLFLWRRKKGEEFKEDYTFDFSIEAVVV
jgi:hypothetical protein